MRDVAIIDSDLRLLVAIRQPIGEAERRSPSTERIDERITTGSRDANPFSGPSEARTRPWTARYRSGRSLNKQGVLSLSGILPRLIQ